MELWVDKYLPKTLEDYVFQNDEVESIIRGFIKKGATDNLFLYGPKGIGKTSLFYVLMNELGVDSVDWLKLNASKHGIDMIREDVNDFIMSGGWGAAVRYIFLDEADGLSPQAQRALRADMEEHSDSIRWIMTANNQHRIIPPLQDRCTVIGLKEQNRERYQLRLISILEQENIAITDENITALETITDRHWPSLRSGIRDLQKYCMSGELIVPEDTKTRNDDLYEKVYEMFKAQKIRAARELLCSSLTKEDIEGAYVWFYQHMDLFTNKDESIIAINEGLKAHGYVADPEINLSATITKLALIND